MIQAIDPMTTTVIALAVFAVLVGTLCSMLGIGGGTVNTPLLIIVFMLGPREASATTLMAAIFISTSSSISYFRQNPRPAVYRAGLFLAMTTIPGSLTGVWLKGVITDDLLLRYLFALLLFPIAVKMLFARRRSRTDMASEIGSFDFNSIGQSRLIAALAAAYGGGVMAGLLGLGGGVIVVPVLSMILGLPMHAAVATSMFTMMFTTSSGTILNLQYGLVNPTFGAALGTGMVIGGQIGSRLACRVDAVRLKQAFGLLLVLPLIKMAKLGQMWLDPQNVNPAMALVGDIIIWFLVMVPVAAIRFVLIRRENGGEIVPDGERCDEGGFAS